MLSREKNDNFYRSHKFEFLTLKSEMIEDYIVIFDEIFKPKENKIINVVIDFSSMTTIIYASILKYFNSYSNKYIEVSLYYIYTQALFTNPSKNVSFSINQPISIFDTLQTTDKSISLIIGLGYEKDKALGLYEYFQNSKQDIYLFFAKNKYEDPFYKLALTNNNDLIKLISNENIIEYNIENVRYVLSLLDTLVNYLISSGKRVVIAPTGTKQFMLIALIVNLFHNEVTTYRLSYGIKSEPIDKFADKTKNPIITLINFRSE